MNTPTARYADDKDTRARMVADPTTLHAVAILDAVEGSEPYCLTCGPLSDPCVLSVAIARGEAHSITRGAVR